ncbi:1-deoxy-D-xylulose-5-phosphate synthase N-terminal domain-containing protein [Kibdelosporangium aridum]|uniref:1-deoxy-D-xylulose-5-phosphate synthase N-terminal domain-containing protein n=1 Tax=Kibdelosporangium aridum TaxID=2030 RepID=UPI0035E5F00C
MPICVSLCPAQLTALAAEIRRCRLVPADPPAICAAGGHLGSRSRNVALTIAASCFRSPTVPISFDIGHQAYMHTILTD